MGQPAYDRNAVRRRRAPQPQRKANLRVAKGGKRRLNPLQAAVHNAMNLVHHNAKGSREVRKSPRARYELPPVSWTTKLKSKKQEAFHVYQPRNET